METVQGDYTEPWILWVFWFFWALNNILIWYSERREKPHLIRIVMQICIIRNIVSIYDFGHKESFKDLGKLVLFTQYAQLGVVAIMLPMTLYENMCI